MKIPAKDEWRNEYVEWKRSVGYLNSPVPDEEGELLFEAQNILAHRAQARRHYSLANFFYYQSVAEETSRLILDGCAQSTARVRAKDNCSQDILFRLDAEGIREDLKDRMFKLEAEIKRVRLTENE